MTTIKLLPVSKIRVNPRNARTHSKKQIRQIADSIRAFGFRVPIQIDATGMLVAGAGRLQAAESIGLTEVPVIEITDLSEAKLRALALADNKIAANAGWDRQRLAVEIPEVAELLLVEGLDISLTGFEPPEIDQLAIDFEEKANDPADAIKPAWCSAAAVTIAGDYWHLGQHRLLCGDACKPKDVSRLMEGEIASMAALDPPYNVKVRSVVGRGRTKHDEFRMASGEMSRPAFINFLTVALGNAAAVSRDSAIHQIFIDWRHIGDLIAAGEDVYATMLNLVVWVKSNAGQGSFYRSQHELIGVFRVGDEPHLNNVQLGRHGRNRSNVWSFPGVNSFRSGRMNDLRAHPTVKPTTLICEALKDCTRRGEIVIDTFCGSGTTILAAERVGRRAYALEIEPRYVDLAIQRWQTFTGKDAIHAETGKTFDELQAERGEVQVAQDARATVRRRA